MDDLAIKVAAAVEAKKQADVEAAMQRDHNIKEGQKFAEAFTSVLIPDVEAALTSANIGLSGTGLVLNGRQELPANYVCVLHGKTRSYSLSFVMTLPNHVTITATTAAFNRPGGRIQFLMPALSELNRKMIDVVLLEFVTDALGRT